MEKIFKSEENKITEPKGMDEVLWQNEIHANRYIAVTMCFCAGIVLVCMILTAVGVFTDNSHVIYRSCIAALAWLIPPSLVCFYFKYAKRWLKYLLMFCLICAMARLDCGLGYIAMLIMIIPVVFSIRYYSFKLTLSVAIITSVIFAVTTYVGATTGFTPIDLNLVEEGANYAKDIMVYSFFPKWLIFLLVVGVSAESAKRGLSMVYEQARISQEHSRVETELHTASQIQMHTLPVAEKVLKKDESTFDLATSIVPAKEVGGDFYDFFYVDPTHVAIVMADVSDKGIPAALYMMISKILIGTSVLAGKNPAQALTAVNQQLSENNEAMMFVTVWLGILDLTTGTIVSANAGHENPIICHADGSVEVIKTKHDFVLGCMRGVRYHNETMTLAPDDTLFIYTDGIPESRNSASLMYGMERLVSSLENKQEYSPGEILDYIQQDVNAFVRETPQFDDSTMLALRLNNLLARDGIQISPGSEAMKVVKDYVERQLHNAKISAKDEHKIKICLDEMYSNIIRYSGATWSEVVCRVEEDTITLILRDNGISHDPTKQATPDVTLGIDERQNGGLGVFMTLNMMDSVTYQSIDGFNETTMVLRVIVDS